jgi:hypothetical protein
MTNKKHMEDTLTYIKKNYTLEEVKNMRLIMNDMYEFFNAVELANGYEYKLDKAIEYI